MNERFVALQLHETHQIFSPFFSLCFSFDVSVLYLCVAIVALFDAMSVAFYHLGMERLLFLTINQTTRQ